MSHREIRKIKKSIEHRGNKKRREKKRGRAIGALKREEREVKKGIRKNHMRGKKYRTQEVKGGAR